MEILKIKNVFYLVFLGGFGWESGKLFNYKGWVFKGGVKLGWGIVWVGYCWEWGIVAVGVL